MENIQSKHQKKHSPKNAMTQPGHSTAMYKQFIIMAIAMFLLMYGLMYAMIDKIDHFIPNINNLYMTSLMTAGMLLTELLVMRNMYPNRKINLSIIIIALCAGIFSWFSIREQANVDDKQFVKGMIPHHAAAILMSEKAALNDPELIQLQKSILEMQAREIAFMQAKLAELQSK